MTHPYMLSFAKKKPPLFISELLKEIEPFEVEERRALLFAALTGEKLINVIALRRKDAMRKYDGLSREILDYQAPHLSCKAAFWRFRSNLLALPLFSLEKRFKKITGVSWDFYMSRFEGVLMYAPPSIKDIKLDA